MVHIKKNLKKKKRSGLFFMPTHTLRVWSVNLNNKASTWFSRLGVAGFASCFWRNHSFTVSTCELVSPLHVPAKESRKDEVGMYNPLLNTENMPNIVP